MWIVVLIVFAALAYFCWPFKVTPIVAQSPLDGGTLPVIRGPGDFEVHVVGESHYQRQLENICGKPSAEGVSLNLKASLVFEDSNKFDKLAVRVDISGAPVGYLNRESSRIFRCSIRNSELKTHSAFQCDALIAGGWDRGRDDKGMYGVRLDLPEGMV
jgi:hypothetical protein